MPHSLAELVATKLRSEVATSLSDEELTRCLRNTVGGDKLITKAKSLRDSGELIMDGDHIRAITAQ